MCSRGIRVLLIFYSCTKLITRLIEDKMWLHKFTTRIRISGFQDLTSIKLHYFTILHFTFKLEITNILKSVNYGERDIMM